VAPLTDERDNVVEDDYDPDILAQDTSPRILRGLGDGQHSGTAHRYTVELRAVANRDRLTS
jgi:hypothetical protein